MANSNHRIGLGTIICLVIGVAIIGFYLGHNTGFSVGYASGEAAQKVSDQKAISGVANGINSLLSQNKQLTAQYNTLSTNYNNLRSAVIQYVGATKYQVSKPIRCTSIAISSTTYTNCN